jgi:hypothetical protein
MRVPNKSVFTTISLLLAALVTDARGQVNLPFGPASYDQDLQMFAPLELDLDNLPADDGSCGFFFGYDKLALSYSGERVTVGDPNIVQFAEVVYRLNDSPPALIPDDNTLGLYYDPYQIQNALMNVPPKAGFALGDRYEFGYRERDNGWMIGVLDGPALYQTETYGFGGDPPLDPGYTNNAGDGVGPQADFDLRAFGYGSVPVLFDTPTDYLRGFRDYLNELEDAASGTQVGPIVYVGNYGTNTEDDEVPVEVFRVADDLDHDLIFGTAVLVDEDDNIIGIVTDFDDLHDFNVFFDAVTVHSAVKTDGVEAMWMHQLSNTHYQAKRQNNRLELSYGARFFRFNDEFRVDAFGSILGDSSWDTTIDNQVVGPQVALRWSNQRQRWTIDTNLKFTFGYNVQDWEQTAAMGSELIPGALNRPLYGRPTYSTHGQRTDEFSPMGELRVEAAYHLTKAFALRVGYTGMYVGNVRRAAPSVRYYLPTMGFQDAGTQNLVANGVHFGVEFVH